MPLNIPARAGYCVTRRAPRDSAAPGDVRELGSTFLPGELSTPISVTSSSGSGGLPCFQGTPSSLLPFHPSDPKTQSPLYPPEFHAENRGFSSPFSASHP